MIKLAFSFTVMMIATFSAAPSMAQDNHWRDIGVHMRTIDDLDGFIAPGINQVLPVIGFGYCDRLSGLSSLS